MKDLNNKGKNPANQENIENSAYTEADNKGKERKFRNFIKEKLLDRFTLSDDAASQDEINANVHKGIMIKGSNLWVLIFAIFIASLGLNINSTAVIIGAMLISPLMGPIIGVGYSMGVYDFNLLKESFRNFLIMVIVSLITSAIFFTLPLISFDQSELLARTQPTTYDILIAFFGGLAGMVAQTRKDRTGTVIPSVAIATALMPPLCTVGYGLATMQLRFILGALYLFTINSIFIALAAFMITRIMKFNIVLEIDSIRKRNLNRLMIAIIVFTTIPSVIIAISIIKRSSFDSNYRYFVEQAFDFEKTIVVESSAQYYPLYRKKPSSIEVRLFGEPLSDDVINNLKNQMSGVYHLPRTDLIVRQSDHNDSGIAITALQSSYTDLINEKNRQISHLQEQLSSIRTIDTLAVSAMTRELGIFVPQIEGMSLSRHVSFNIDGAPKDTIFICILSFQEDAVSEKAPDMDLIRHWLINRTGTDNIKILVEQSL
ncbi:MAG: DUF389 domain-containing protein [Bacteroidales bacterium]|nr:DUF389 domain-containing protein [Bacteroidales bacterium]